MSHKISILLTGATLVAISIGFTDSAFASGRRWSSLGNAAATDPAIDHRTCRRVYRASRRRHCRRHADLRRRVE